MSTNPSWDRPGDSRFGPFPQSPTQLDMAGLDAEFGPAGLTLFSRPFTPPTFAKTASEWAFDPTGGTVNSASATTYSWSSGYLINDSNSAGVVLSVSAGALRFANYTLPLHIDVVVFWVGAYTADATKFLAHNIKVDDGVSTHPAHQSVGSQSAGYKISTTGWTDLKTLGGSTITPDAVTTSSGLNVYPGGIGSTNITLKLYQNTGTAMTAYPWVCAVQLTG